MPPTGHDLVASWRKLLGAPYVWWEEGDPIPRWLHWYDEGVQPSVTSIYELGIMCSDLITWGLLDNGIWLPGHGTPAYQDLIVANGGTNFDPDAPGEAGAVAVNGGWWRDGSGQGHIAGYTDEHTLIQATDGVGDFAGVNEGEQDYNSYQWANYFYYGYLPGIDYSGSGEPEVPLEDVISIPKWHSIDSNGWWRANGPDWSGGWYEVTEDGYIGIYHGPGDA